jgi:hypothetical protein
MRAASISAKSMEQDLGYMLVARSGLTKLGIASTTEQGPSFSLLGTMAFAEALEAHHTLKQACTPHAF